MESVSTDSKITKMILCGRTWFKKQKHSSGCIGSPHISNSMEGQRYEFLGAEFIL